MKRKSTVLSQVMGTTVVASFVEKEHPMLNPSVPCILMDKRCIQIVMYDCVADVLLICKEYSLFTSDTRGVVAKLLLWLFVVYNYILF